MDKWVCKPDPKFSGQLYCQVQVCKPDPKFSGEINLVSGDQTINEMTFERLD